MFDFTIMLLSILGGVHSFLNGVREKRYEVSCRQLLAECTCRLYRHVFRGI